MAHPRPEPPGNPGCRNGRRDRPVEGDGPVLRRVPSSRPNPASADHPAPIPVPTKGR
jgi:hypothetical protein